MQKPHGTILLKRFPSVETFAAVVGKKEGNGPLRDWFDIVSDDTSFGEKTWEKAESRMQQLAFETALRKGDLEPTDLNLLFAGDLLNQCIGSAYGLRKYQIPFYGLYGACSTMAESLSLAALFVAAGYVKRAGAVTSSHFCASERQFRQPLEYGGQRAPTSQWTVTGAGAAILSDSNQPPFVKAITTGKITDLGIADVNNMGAAMAPAAYETIRAFLSDTDTKPCDYDLIVTGDLGAIGTELLHQLAEKEGLYLRGNHTDCGMMIFDREKQDVHAGGSGCGCSASVLCGNLLKRIKTHHLREVLFVATGALMSTTSFQQGESVLGIAHLVHLSDNNRRSIWTI